MLNWDWESALFLINYIHHGSLTLEPPREVPIYHPCRLSTCITKCEICRVIYEMSDPLLEEIKGVMSVEGVDLGW